MDMPRNWTGLPRSLQSLVPQTLSCPLTAAGVPAGGSAAFAGRVSAGLAS
ncbi:hypothetical protein GTW66_07710 [Streptomyces sp. SID5473]|nr:hypothetical protein [Streptomyces sp. SID5473]MYS63979.1 hypothetical protein [Streptomyces sp. SID5473]